MSHRSAAKSSVSSAALGFMAPAAGPPAAAADSAASPAALAKLEGAIAELKALTIIPLLRRAIDALREEDAKAGTDWALKALQQDAESGMAWYVLAVAREKAGDFASSVKAYHSALALLPDETAIANDLGRLAFRMGMKELAEQLFRRYLEKNPESVGTIVNLTTVLRDLGRGPEAIDILKAAIKRFPDNSGLWNTVGTILTHQGDLATAIIFYDEALRLDPNNAQARYNRGNCFLELGDSERALPDCEAALELALTPDDRLMMQLARSTIKLTLGRLGDGWDDYEARLDPLLNNSTLFLFDRPRWTPETPLAGKSLLIVGEQGLGDEVLFANMLPDVLKALGPDGKLALAISGRLAPLFRRSFPGVEVVEHVTLRKDGRDHRVAPALGDQTRFDLWVPMASLLRVFRRELGDFPARKGFMKADKARVAHWRRTLKAAGPGPKVGILWKSMKLESARARYYSPFELWTPVLKTPGVRFINVQYGDCDAELAWARDNLGVDIWTPPGIDLKNDLDDIGALACALDLTLGFANATSNIAAGCGAPTWIISVPGAWTRLGTDAMPWYPQARIFTPAALNKWEDTMAEVAVALANAWPA